MNLKTIKERIQSLATKKITLGFDGFVDEIVKAIRTVDNQHQPVYFDSVKEFGNYIVDKSGKNFAIELEEVVTKIGGNMPIMANALAALGTQPSCIGTLGFPKVHRVFENMPSNCLLYSFANPGVTKAFEFNGSKILMAEMGDLNHVDWKTIMEAVGPEILRKLFVEPDLVCLLNWSELKNSNAIWKGLLTDVLVSQPIKTNKPFAFVDLADCSRKSPDTIIEAIELLKDFSAHWNVVLGLNLNEAIHVHKVLVHQVLKESDIETIGTNLFKRLSIHSIVIHYSKQAFTWDSNGIHQKKSGFIEHPKISTGAGDNFNAGYCAGLLMEMDAETSLVLGHAVSGYYMQQGQSPTALELVHSILVG